MMMVLMVLTRLPVVLLVLVYSSIACSSAAIELTLSGAE